MPTQTIGAGCPLSSMRIVRAFRKVVDVVDTLRLSIDFRKSWHWATSKAFRDFCTQLHTDKGASAQVLSVVKDLGARRTSPLQ